MKAMYSKSGYESGQGWWARKGEIKEMRRKSVIPRRQTLAVPSPLLHMANTAL